MIDLYGLSLYGLSLMNDPYGLSLMNDPYGLSLMNDPMACLCMACLWSYGLSKIDYGLYGLSLILYGLYFEYACLLLSNFYHRFLDRPPIVFVQRHFQKMKGIQFKSRFFKKSPGGSREIFQKPRLVLISVHFSIFV